MVDRLCNTPSRFCGIRRILWINRAILNRTVVLSRRQSTGINTELNLLRPHLLLADYLLLYLSSYIQAIGHYRNFYSCCCFNIAEIEPWVVMLYPTDAHQDEYTLNNLV